MASIPASQTTSDSRKQGDSKVLSAQESERSPTEQTSSVPQNPSDSKPTGRKKRRRTSHLKKVPETRELRDQLREKCAEVAAKLDKSHPLTKDEMESVARRTLEEVGLDEGYVGWAMVMLSSEFFRDAVAGTDPSRRLFLLPHCLKHAEGCPADYDEFGMNCKQCGACSIADFRTIAEDMGYKVLVAEGSPVVLKIIVSGYVDAIVGVACLNVLEKAIDKILLAGIPCMAVPLLSSDCRNTSVDEDWVRDMVLVGQNDSVTDHSTGSDSKTASYLHLMRAANDMFQSPRIDSLIGRRRESQGIDLSSDDCIRTADPVALTEAIAFDFVAKGGKYSRPFMTLSAYDAMTGGKATLSDGSKVLSELHESHYRAAMSIEMFHKASLVHDDIEDDDRFRYGQPTLHRRFGLPTAINVGDYLIGLGYRMVSREAGTLGSDTTTDILDCLADAHTRLSEGQGAELLWRDNRDKQLQPIDALKIYALKTSPAFEAALYTGVRLAGNASAYVEPIRHFARNIGVAFQILNDLKDWVGDQNNKMHPGGDILGGRPTLLLALALQSLQGAEREELLAIVNQSDDRTADQRYQRAFALFNQVKVVDQANILVDKHHARAMEVANSLEIAPLRKLLVYLLDTVLERVEVPMPNVVNLNLGAVAPASTRA